MTRQQIDLYPVAFGPSEPIDTTEDEDLIAATDPRHLRPTDPRTARARGRLVAVALSAAGLTWGLFTMAHGPTGTSSLAPTQAASGTSLCATDLERSRRVASYQSDWTAQRAGER